MRPELDPALEATLRQRLGVFYGNGVFFREPSGGVNGVTAVLPQLRPAGFSWIALQAFDGAGEKDWSDWLRLGASYGLQVIPWARCRTVDGLHTLGWIRSSWQARTSVVDWEQPELPAILTARAIAGTHLTEAGEHLGLSTEPWLPEGVDYRPLDCIGTVCLPQAWWDLDGRWSPSTVAGRAAQEFSAVAPSFGVEPDNIGAARYLSDWPAGGFSLLFGDNVAGFGVWRR